ncbi:hypothetical protein C9374_009751 [Naegleria lovaniensis]|uniref:Uncharacterized protein n=1 Tax=Naegleria lovaniensis TaxID=51637 RepID=A0AA88KS07_NAELO|nr:uncharacterized protein C9374_009751 [Naegleria lovaniensis]KAG2393174.1 hypothetical protein C9374_009751 [Naegleria lovaniensis]
MKLSKSNSTMTDSVKIILINFHHHSSSWSETPLDSHVCQIFQLLKRKFEHQAKGFCKWLKAKDEWLQQDQTHMKLEFMHDRDSVLKWKGFNPWTPDSNSSGYIHKMMMLQPVDIEELYHNTQELIDRVEFWHPFKKEILSLIMAEELDIFDFFPKHFIRMGRRLVQTIRATI